MKVSTESHLFFADLQGHLKNKTMVRTYIYVEKMLYLKILYLGRATSLKIPDVSPDPVVAEIPRDQLAMTNGTTINYKPFTRS